MAKKSLSFIIALVLLVASIFLIANIGVHAYLAPIPEVGPGACAWRNPVPNGPRCDESHQKCAPGCPEISTPLIPQGSGSTEQPSSYQSPSSSEEESGDSCGNSRVLSCASICRSVKQEKKQMCFANCISKNSNAVKSLTKCAKKVAKAERKRVEVRAAREARQQARDEARRTGRVTSVNAPPETTLFEEEPFDFSITVSPSPQKVSPRGVAKYSVQVRPVGKGKPKSVLLSFGGSGIFDLVKNRRATWSFGGSSSREDTPPFSTTFTITTTSSSIPGDYNLAVRGVGGAVSRTGNFDLEILAPEKPSTPQPPEWSTVKDKLAKVKGQKYVKGEDFGKPLTKEEFLVYLRELESKNPNMGWKTITAYLHARAYEAKGDLKNTLGKTLAEHPTLEKIPFSKDLASNTPLFIHVPETNKRKEIKDVSDLYGRFIINDNGEKVDMAHSYAGLRSDIGRIPGSIDQEKMRMVNTYAGDYYQELSPPNEQLKGNKIGYALSRYYQDPKNANKKLSEAYVDILASK